MYSTRFWREWQMHCGVNWCRFSNSELASTPICSVLPYQHRIRQVVQLDVRRLQSHWSQSSHQLCVHCDRLREWWDYRQQCRMPHKNRFVLAPNLNSSKLSNYDMIMICINDSYLQSKADRSQLNIQCTTWRKQKRQEALLLQRYCTTCLLV